MRACGVRRKYLKTQSKGSFLRRPFEPAAVCGQINRLATVLGDLLRCTTVVGKEIFYLHYKFIIYCIVCNYYLLLVLFNFVTFYELNLIKPLKWAHLCYVKHSTVVRGCYKALCFYYDLCFIRKKAFKRKLSLLWIGLMETSTLA